MHYKKNDGFTLVEVLTVVAIIGIVAAIATPMFLSFRPNIQLRAATRDLYGAAMQAKVEAAKNGINCTMTFNEQIGSVTYAYIIYEDSDYDFQYDSPGERLIKTVIEYPSGVSLDSSQGTGGLTLQDNGTGNPSIAFMPTGLPTDSSGSFASGAVSLKNSNGRSATVNVNRVGGISIN